jgi:hypothetical protein
MSKRAPTKEQMLKQMFDVLSKLTEEPQEVTVIFPNGPARMAALGRLAVAAEQGLVAFERHPIHQSRIMGSVSTDEYRYEAKLRPEGVAWVEVMRMRLGGEKASA